MTGIQLTIDGIVAGAAYAMLGLGFSLIFSVTRTFHVAHGGIYTLAAYLAITLSGAAGHWLLAVVLAVLLSAAVGVLMEASVYRELRRRRAPELIVFIASLGMLIFLENLIALVYGVETRDVAGEVGVTWGSWQVAGYAMTGLKVAGVVLAAALVGAIVVGLRATLVGRRMRAVANNPEMAGALGIPVRAYYYAAFFLGSLLAAVAGIISSLDFGITPTAGLTATLIAMLAMIVGGVGSLTGGIIGGMVAGIIESLAVWQIDSQWQSAVLFALLMVLILVRPRGLFGEHMTSVKVG